MKENAFSEEEIKHIKANLHLPPAPQMVQRKDVKTMEVLLAGSEERCKILLESKNIWADRARKAEAELLKLK